VPEPLSRDRILLTALSLIDRGGFEALSMRRLAAELGVAPMSLYNHVTDRSDLEAGLLDLVLRPSDSSIEVRGRPAAVAAVTELRAALLDHPGLVPLLATPAGNQAITNVATRAVSGLGEDGLDPDALLTIFQTTMWFVIGAVIVPTAGSTLELPGWREKMDTSFQLGLDALLDGFALRRPGTG